MIRHTNRTNGRPFVLANLRFEQAAFLGSPASLEQVRDDQRLRRALKRAVTRDLAPQSLIDSIRREIRQ